MDDHLTAQPMLLELLAEPVRVPEDMEDSVAFSVTRRGDGQTTPDE